MSILISIFISGYHGKTTDFAKNSSYHRTTIAHFLNSGKWDDSLLSDTLKQSVIEIIYSEAARTGNPVFCIVDDTIASKTKPSSRALHPIEDAYFHQSHLKGKPDYGHQAVAVMLSCNGIVLNYAFVMFFANAKRNWHWTAIRYVLHRGSEDFAADVTGAFYVRSRNWRNQFF